MSKQAKGKGNNPIVWCFSKKYSEQCENHYEFEEFSGENIAGKFRTEVSYRDVYLEPAGRLNIFPKGAEELKKRKKILLEAGTRTQMQDTTHRQIIIYEPLDEKDIPSGLEGTPIGEALVLRIALRNYGVKVADVVSKREADMDTAVEIAVSSYINDVMKNRIKEDANYQIKNMNVNKTETVSHNEPSIVKS